MTVNSPDREHSPEMEAANHAPSQSASVANVVDATASRLADLERLYGPGRLHQEHGVTWYVTPNPKDPGMENYRTPDYNETYNQRAFNGASFEETPWLSGNAIWGV